MKEKEKPKDIADSDLIDWYIAHCAGKDMNLQQMAEAVGKTKTWASQIVNHKVRTLKFQTRNRIKRILGELS